MERSSSIVYLCTENNLKSCLGLDALIQDGWNISLVISYKAPSHRRTTRQKFWGGVHILLRLMEQMIFRPPAIMMMPVTSCQQICEANQINYIQTEDCTLEGCREHIYSLNPDVILSNGWMFKIESGVAKLARIACLNCHSSYLPEYRGGNVTYAPIINGETQSGVSVHEVLERFDSGRILAQHRVSVDPMETPQTLNTKRALITAGVLIEALEIAGNETLYLNNPLSSFYFRCSYPKYLRLRLENVARKLLGISIKRYSAQNRYDI
jgi:folate-dependent phosphoribosylglycinamide formyltransferase PurN